MNNLFDLRDKIAVVTGASSGIGAEAAKAYADAGAQVAILARREEKLLQLKAEIEELGGKCFVQVCDVRDEASVKTAIENVLNTFGRIDILLNDAGLGVIGSVHEMSGEDWDKAFETNVKGTFLMNKYVVPTMMAQRYGKIINIASLNALIGDKGELFTRHAYNSCKSAILGMTTGMAATYAKYGITVNAIGPGLFETKMTGPLFESPEFLAGYDEVNPTGRPAYAGELNGTILYLSSDASSYVQGQFILVDGGFSIV